MEYKDYFDLTLGTCCCPLYRVHAAEQMYSKGDQNSIRHAIKLFDKERANIQAIFSAKDTMAEGEAAHLLKIFECNQIMRARFPVR